MADTKNDDQKSCGNGEKGNRRSHRVDPTGMHLLSILWCVAGAVGIVMGLFGIMLAAEVLVFSRWRDVSTVIFFLVCGVFGFIYWRAGYGIFKKTITGHRYAIIACYAMMIKIPIGTLIGYLALKHLKANESFYARAERKSWGKARTISCCLLGVLFFGYIAVDLTLRVQKKAKDEAEEKNWWKRKEASELAERHDVWQLHKKYVKEKIENPDSAIFPKEGSEIDVKKAAREDRSFWRIWGWVDTVDEEGNKKRTKYHMIIGGRASGFKFDSYIEQKSLNEDSLTPDISTGEK
ncbi:MAG: hypothetical protein JXR97_13245 [Planctomycetes bacterium]|nr:hypothetical protein [Planctomycetota bacterium]